VADLYIPHISQLYSINHVTAHNCRNWFADIMVDKKVKLENTVPNSCDVVRVTKNNSRTVQTRKILHQLGTFGNVNKQYCGSDV